MNTVIDKFRTSPALWIAIVYGFGIIIGWIFLSSLNAGFLTILAAGLILAAFLLRKYFLFSLIPAIFVLGILNLYVALNTFPANHLVFQNLKNTVTVTGWIEEAQFREDGKHRYVLHCEKLHTDSTEKYIQGLVYLFQGKCTTRFQYGDRIQLTAPLQQPPLPGNPGEFNFRKYLHLKNIHFQTRLNNETVDILHGRSGNPIKQLVLLPLQEILRSKINKFIPPPTAAVVKALILGERQDMDRQILRQFQKTGIVHVLAISGLHVGFILLFFMLTFGLLGFSYNKRVLFSLLILFLFVALVGFKAPVLRAAMMAALYFAAQWRQLKINSLNIIGIAGLIILIVAPEQLLTPGFQFSFAAVGGILYGYPKLKSANILKSNFHLVNKWIIQPFMVSLSAVLATVPLTWIYYGTLQTGAVFINILLIPLIGGFVVICFIFIILTTVGLPIGVGLGQVIHYYFSGILQINDFFAGLPYIQFSLPNPSTMVVILIIILIWLLFNLRLKLTIPAVITILSIIFLTTQKTNSLLTTFVNVGQGDCSIFQFPNGKTMIIDGGDRVFSFDAGERYLSPLLKYYGIHHIDYLVVTHSHSDHYGGFISLMENFSADTLILSRYQAKSKMYAKLKQNAQANGVAISYKKRGDQIKIGSEYRVYVLHPFGDYLKANAYSGKEVNNSSLVLKISYGDCSFLLNGDMEKDAETNLFNYGSFLQSDILKVGHHGSKTSTTDSLLSLVQPDYSVVSVGRGNKFFHPSRTTIARLKAVNAHPLRTDHFGALVFKSNGTVVQLVNWH